MVIEMIPKQLQDPEFRFNLLKKKSKEPLQLDWQNTNNYSFDNPKLINWINNGGNYGVVCGNGLIVIDADTERLREIVKKELPETFSVETNSGVHYYYYCIGFSKKKVLKDNEGHLGEIQSTGTFIVCPKSTHPSGKRYKIINDIGIVELDKKVIDIIFDKYYSSDRLNKEVILDGIGEGLRNESMFKLACSFRTKNLKPEETLQALESINEKNKPPLSNFELKAIIESAYKYKQSGDSNINEYKFEEKIKDYKGISKEDLRQEVYMLLLNKDKAKATELIVKSIEENEHIYTIREDENTEMWIYHEGIYIPYAKTFIKEWCREILNEVNTTFLSNQVIFKIETDTYIDKDDFFKEETPDLIPVQNGVLNLRTRKLLPFSHKYKFFNKLPMNYNPESKCPNITKFFNSVLRDEKDIEVLQEIFGCLLYKNYFLEKAFMFLGDGRNGKGKTLELMKKFLGVDNCSEITLEALETDQYALGELFKKMGNLCGDISATALKNSGNFKKLTGRDLVSASRKFLTRIHFINYAKMVFSANQLPFTYDKKLAFFSRWVIINFPFTFLPQKEFEVIDITKRKDIKLQDPEIVEKIATEEELEGLLNISLNGLDRLFKNKTCSYSPSIKDVEIEWLRKSNSFNAFYMDCLEEKYDGKITKTELRRSYSLYCREHKLLMVGDKSIKHILEEFGAGEDYLTNAEGDRVYCWVGLKFNKKVQGVQDEQGFTTYREFVNLPRS